MSMKLLLSSVVFILILNREMNRSIRFVFVLLCFHFLCFVFIFCFFLAKGKSSTFLPFVVVHFVHKVLVVVNVHVNFFSYCSSEKKKKEIYKAYQSFRTTL